MIDILPFIACLCLLPAHEFGHYIMAWKFGWQPKFTVTLWKKWMPAFAVYTTMKGNIKTEQDFLRLYAKLTAFSTMGTLMTWLAILFFHWIGIFTVEVAFLGTIFFGAYGLLETSYPTIELRKDEAEYV